LQTFQKFKGQNANGHFTSQNGAVSRDTVHLLHLDSTETAENVGNVFAHDVPLIYARRCKGVGWLIKIEHSKEKKKGRNKRGRLEKKRLSFLCFFSKKQRRLKKKATSSGGRKQLAHQSSITSPFPCF